MQKTKPLKKIIRETDAIFDNVRQENQAADDDPDVIRISMATPRPKWRDLGDYSPETENPAVPSRPRPWNHDPEPRAETGPAGDLGRDLVGSLSIFIATSNGTSDFFADCPEQWWEANESRYPHGRRLVINLDNGPENSSHRTQFMNRMVMFADATDLEIKLVYYPPYHSKYNPIEHCWGVLERPLERDLAEQRRHRGRMGWDDNLERDSPDRQTDRDDLRQRRSHCQGRLQSHREPTPTPRQPPQVRCPHPTSTRLIDLGWLEARIASRDGDFSTIAGDYRSLARWSTFIVSARADLGSRGTCPGRSGRGSSLEFGPGRPSSASCDAGGCPVPPRWRSNPAGCRRGRSGPSPSRGTRASGRSVSSL